MIHWSVFVFSMEFLGFYCSCKPLGIWTIQITSLRKSGFSDSLQATVVKKTKMRIVFTLRSGSMLFSTAHAIFLIWNSCFSIRPNNVLPCRPPADMIFSPDTGTAGLSVYTGWLKTSLRILQVCFPCGLRFFFLGIIIMIGTSMQASKTCSIQFCYILAGNGSLILFFLNYSSFFFVVNA